MVITMRLKSVNIHTGMVRGARLKNFFGHVADQNSHFPNILNLLT